MEEAATILVIILSVVLSIFLVVGIVLVVALIKLTNKVREIAETADHIVDNVDTATQAFKNAAGPLAAGKVIMNIVEMVTKGKKGK